MSIVQQGGANSHQPAPILRGMVPDLDVTEGSASKTCAGCLPLGTRWQQREWREHTVRRKHDISLQAHMASLV